MRVRPRAWNASPSNGCAAPIMTCTVPARRSSPCGSNKGIGKAGYFCKNPLWKQAVELVALNNQQFVQIPHARFIQMLRYKAELADITVKVQEESYTSKASFLDLDPSLPAYDPQR